MTVKVVLGVDAIRPPLTGIGRYAWELASRLPRSPGVAEVRYFGQTGFVADAGSLLDPAPARRALRARLVASRVAAGLYRRVAPHLQSVLLRSLEDAVFHGPNFYLPPFPGRAVATIHDLSIYRYPGFHPRARVEHMRREIPRSIARADLILTDCERVRREVMDEFSWPEDRVVAIPLAAGTEFRPRPPQESQATLARLGLVHGAYALCVATIEPRKNIAALMRAYAGLAPAVRERFPLVLAGDRGWLSDDVHDAIGRAARQGWLRYLGYIDEGDLPSLYAGARAFALPSLYEGFGLPLLEAMACGLPCLTSRDTALAELADGAAWLVDPHDDDHIRDGLRRVLEDDAWRGGARERGLAVAARHAWETTVERTVAAYGGCVAGAHRRGL